MRKYLTYFLILTGANAFAQAPVINNIQPLNAGPTQKIVINGNGFDATAANNLVWFDHMKGTVTAATIYSLEVQVPAGARFSNVEVINLTNKLSAKSQLKFLPSYGGVPFDVTNTKNVKVDSSSLEFFDIASADFDMDGDVDMVSSRGGPTSTAPITDIYVHQNVSSGIGNISFTRISLTVGAPTANVACGDLNGDGKPDIIASRGGNTRNEIFVLKNTNSTAGVISFAPKVTFTMDALQSAFRLSIRDLNADGKPEMIVSNAFDTSPAANNQIYVFPNTSSAGTISFGPSIKLTATGAVSTYGLDVQDLDGDTRPDIIVNQFQSQDVFVFKNSSSGSISFDPVQVISAAGKFNNITSSDLNKDGLLDLIATSTLSDNIQIWINKSTPGNIAFNTSTTLPSSRGPWGVDVSDIDGDGDADIIIANKNGVGTQFDPTDVKINIFRQDGALTFTRFDITTANPTRNLRVGDYDGDGKADIAYTSFPSSGLTYRVDVIRNKNCWAPAISGSSTKICIGQTIPLQTQPALGVTYDWKLGGVSQGVNASLLSATAGGTYTVTLNGTVDTGCSNTSAGYVLTPDNTAAFPSDPVISNNVPCLGANLNLSTGSVATASYKWSGPNNFSTTTLDPSTGVTIPSVTNAAAGVYSLQVTLANGCQSNIVTKQLDIASVPVLPVTATPGATGCVGGSITLSVSGSGFTYKWNKGGVAISPAETNASLVLNSLAAAQEGDYSVTVTSIANTCSQETAKTTVRVFAVPTPNFSVSTPTCQGVPVTFTDGTTGADNRGTLVYAWTFGDAATSALQSPTHTYASANTFSVGLTVSYTGGACPANVSKPTTVSASVLPSITPSANPICKGDQTTLSISGSFNTITWSGGTLTGNTSSVVVTDSAKYAVNTTDANGCLGNSTIHITLNPSFSPFKIATYKNRTSIGSGDTLKLNATTGADSYSWTPTTALSPSAAVSNPVASPTATTKYIVIAAKAGLCSAKDSITVTVGAGEAIINPPVLFSPNGDAYNDVWKLCGSATNPNPASCPEDSKYSEWTMTIFDSQGGQVFQKKGFTEWNGGSAPDGIYYYVFSNSQGKPATGSVLLVRQKQ